MAIPFYEDEPVAAAAQITAADQVDGVIYASDAAAGYDQVDYEAPPSAAGAAATSGSETETPPPPSTEEQLLVWKMLALAMCKVLKQFYMQQKQQQQQQTGKSTKLTATVQIQPQAQ
ncbi:uncharacterized protein LOC6558203 [Drosophila grimshawi]|uniref:GH17113 n=1 Tax=Drosophila grimshawi TaxID=7222 RepID=B4J0M0_DROGR|nr:uncharacterized protein LOC6558203 [Drosophila grimshawi]EDV97875.1 GH17113 [Drosophila grimshawi]